MKKILYLIRGLPGAGKTTFAQSLGCPVFSADDYFTDDEGHYYFDAKKLQKAHVQCYSQVSECMKSGLTLAVTNTFTRESEINPYYQLAHVYGYTVFSVIIENRHGCKSVHNVPEQVIDKMKKRFSIKL